MFLASLGLVLGCIFTEKKEATYAGETQLFYRLAPYGIIILFIIFIIFFIENFISMKNSDIQIEPSPENIGLQEEDDIVPTKNTVTGKDWAKSITFFVLGAAGIVLGAQLLVNAGTALAKDIGISQRIISVIAVAIGTSLPELVTAITALRKKEGALTAGNILGANIIDLSLILPICAFVSHGNLAVSVSSVTIDMIVCLAAVSVAVFPTIIFKKFQRWQGGLMLAGYIGYVIFTFVG